MARKFGVLPHVLLTEPYENFLLDMWVYMVGQAEVDQEITGMSKNDGITEALAHIREI